jgi:4-aminobutyrate aminotransferase
MSEDNIIARAAEVFTPALHLYYPVKVVRGDGVYVYTADGKSFLDFSSGLAVLNIGHNHPRVMEAARNQLDSLIHTGGVYYNETTVAAAEKLLSVVPAELEMLFFSNSGAEAVEGALKVARFATGRQGIISFTRGFHGRTLGAVSVTTSSTSYRNKYHPLLPSVFQVPYPYCCRCPYRQAAEGCDQPCFHELEETLRHQIAPEETAAIIIEPFLGEGGYFPAPTDFLRSLRELCDRHGILLIFDEVQSGIGRTGRWFACDHAGVPPDIMTVAKGVASGFPLSAVVGKKRIMKEWLPGAHGTTFGGNPVSCAASLATIEVIAEQGLTEQTFSRGGNLLSRLKTMACRHSCIGSVRGYGFMIGIEIITEEGLPDGDTCDRVLQYCLEKGVILIACAQERNVIRFIPPLITTDEELDFAISTLDEGILARS